MLEPAWRLSIGKDGNAGEKWKRGVVWEMVIAVGLF